MYGQAVENLAIDAQVTPTVAACLIVIEILHVALNEGDKKVSLAGIRSLYVMHLM